MDEFSYLYSLEDIDENKIIHDLNDFKNILSKNPVDMESFGLIQFNFIEKNLISILFFLEKYKSSII